MIGKQYYFLSLAAVLIGMILSWLVRFHLAWASVAIPGLQHLSQVGAPGGIITPEYYLSLLTLHGTLMVFFVLTTAPQAGFGNYFLPIQIGAEDMAFPRLNMISFWVTFSASSSWFPLSFVSDGPPIAGWTAYAPFSGWIRCRARPGTGQIAVGIFHRDFLHRFAAGCVEFHRHHSGFARQGHVADAHALHQLGLVYHRGLGLTRLRRVASRVRAAALDRMGGTSFFIPGGLIVSDKLMPSFGRVPTAVAAHVLVLRPSRGLHRHPPGMGMTSHILSATCAQAIFGRDQGFGGWHGLDRFSELHGLGSPYVHERHEPLLVAHVFGSTMVIAVPSIHRDVELDWHGFRSAPAFAHASSSPSALFPSSSPAD